MVVLEAVALLQYQMLVELEILQTYPQAKAVMVELLVLLVLMRLVVAGVVRLLLVVLELV
jgi:hypothetical protein